MNSTEAIAACPFHAGHAAAPALPHIDFFDPAFKADPHRAWAALRQQAPVHRTMLPDGRPLWLVTRQIDVRRVLSDPRFVKDRRAAFDAGERAAAPRMPPAMRYLARHLLAVDPPQHTRLRQLVLEAFSPRLVEAMAPRIQAIADELLDAALPRGRLELIEDYALPLPITVICELLGIPAADRALLRGWSNVLITNAGATDAAAVAVLAPLLEELSAWLRWLFAHKRHHPGDDLTTELVMAHHDAEQLDEDELIAMLLLLIVAGHETATHLIGNGVLALLQHPAQLALLRREPALLPAAVEELLRYDGPVETSTLRYAAEDIALHGQWIRRGELVMVVLSSANRDSGCVPRAQVLDIGREPQPHLAFGHGLHYCLGAALARMEGAIAIGTLLRRAPVLRLAVAPSALQWQLGPLTRGLVALPLWLEQA